jgi:2-polyprenyl-3-methyl-5-hydroxy-6-metoxy-1,4-benzoquinol methylase
MTTWDKIYKSYLKGGEAYATLSREMNPLFKKFIENKEFKLKRVLDIGCGDGRHLKFLQAKGFKTDGIDSSETAVDMAKKLLGDDSDIKCADMFEFNIPPGRYDLIISLQTIHHGLKEQVQKVISRIHDSLADSGKVFITLPSLEAKHWSTLKKRKEIAPNTYVPLEGPEAGLPHSIYSKGEVRDTFSKFSNVEIVCHETQWCIQAEK